MKYCRILHRRVCVIHSSIVLDETIEEGRLFHIGIVLDSGHHYKQAISTASREIDLLGQILFFLKRHCTGVFFSLFF